jgi:hypothetical protein
VKILLTKLTNERHRLAIERDDGTRESVDLETRSFLLHDLVHFAVEAEANIADGFWGLLAEGTTLDDLADRTMADPISPGIALAERLTGPMQSVWNERLDRALYVEQAKLDFVTIDFVERVCKHLRALTGHWKATPFHETMAIFWPPS